MILHILTTLAVVDAFTNAKYAPVSDPPPSLTIVLPHAGAQEFDCTGSRDGYFDEGECKERFWQCTGESATYLKCPDYRVYDGRGSCIHPATCRNQNMRTTQPPTPPMIDNEYFEHATSSPLPQRDISRFSCAGLGDGLYSITPCQPRYYQCSMGVKYEQSCNHGMVFNERRQACDYSDSCRNSLTGNDQPLPTASNSGHHRPASQQPRDTFCLDKPDGYYGSGCQNFFYSCTSRNTNKMDCSLGLFYDPVQRRCDQSARVASCNRRVSVSDPPIPSSSAEAPSGTICSGKHDGLYAFAACSQSFIQCSNGVARPRDCRFGLYYNMANGLCDSRDHIDACNTGSKKTRDFDRRTPQPTRQQQRPSSASCSGLRDGVHAQGCSNVYLSCAAGYGTQMTCPSHLRFSASSRACDAPANVAECGGTPPINNNDEYNTNYASPPPAPDASRDASFCRARSDGAYGNGCSKDYTICNKNVANTLSCPSHLVYSQERGTCEYRESVAACGGRAPPPTAQPTPLY